MLRDFEQMYLAGEAPWDTGVPSTELGTRLAAGQIPPGGMAVDLGCGTGTNVLYLARHGWQAVGVDYAIGAIRAARRKASARPLDVAGRCTFHRGDVTDLSFLGPPFDLALDMGCFHTLGPGERGRYAHGLARLLRPGAIYMLYAFKPGDDWCGGVREDDVPGLFGPAFRVRSVEQGAGRPSAWYTLERA